MTIVALRCTLLDLPLATDCAMNNVWHTGSCGNSAMHRSVTGNMSAGPCGVKGQLSY